LSPKEIVFNEIKLDLEKNIKDSPKSLKNVSLQVKLLSKKRVIDPLDVKEKTSDRF